MQGERHSCSAFDTFDCFSGGDEVNETTIKCRESNSLAMTGRLWDAIVLLCGAAKIEVKNCCKEMKHSLSNNQNSSFSLLHFLRLSFHLLLALSFSDTSIGSKQ